MQIQLIFIIAFQQESQSRNSDFRTCDSTLSLRHFPFQGRFHGTVTELVLVYVQPGTDSLEIISRSLPYICRHRSKNTLPRWTRSPFTWRWSTTSFKPVYFICDTCRSNWYLVLLPFSKNLSPAIPFDIWQARGQILSTYLSCGSIYFNVIGSKRLSTAATIASEEIRPGQHRHLKSEFRFSYLCISRIARWPNVLLPLPDIQRRRIRNSFHVDAHDSSALLILTWIQSNDVVWELDFAI